MKNNLSDLFKNYKNEVFRLQTLTEYNVDDEKDAFDKFKRDGMSPDVNVYADWNENIRTQTSAGKKFINTNLVLDSGPTQYQKFGFFFKQVQSECGIDYRFMNKSEFEKMTQKQNVTPLDFWMFDEKIVFEMLYNENGNWLGNREITDLDLIQKLITLKNEFIKNSYDFDEYKKRWF